MIILYDTGLKNVLLLPMGLTVQCGIEDIKAESPGWLSKSTSFQPVLWWCSG